MGIFDDVVLQWEGEEKTIPADRVMRLIAKLEDVLTLHELYGYLQRGTAPLAKVSIAYTVALNWAGFRVTEDHVYKRLIEVGEKSDTAGAVVRSLLTMMVPPDDLDVEQSGNEGATEPGKSKAASKTSKPRIKRQ